MAQDGLVLRSRGPSPPSIPADQAERDAYESASRFWAKIFAVNFAVGVVTGIPLEFQFGTNWARFSNYAGGVIGTTLAMEGVFAFFAESVFLGIFLAGRDRVSPRIHYLSAIFVFVGSWLSGFFIIATNAWMQHPVAYSGAGDKVQLDSFWGLLTNDWVSWQYLHNMSGAAITGAFVLAAMGAFFLLSGKHEQFARISISVGVVGALIFSALPDLPDRRPRRAQRRRAPARRVRGDGGPVRNRERGAARDHRQPEHGHARAGVDDRDAEAPVIPDLAPLGREDHGSQRHRRGRVARLGPARLLRVPHHGRAGDDPARDRGLLAVFLLWRGKLFTSKAMLWALMLAFPFTYIANIAGWVTAETARQPWVVYGLLRTKDAASPAESVPAGTGLFTLLGFAGLYMLVGHPLPGADRPHRQPGAGGDRELPTTSTQTAAGAGEG